MFGEVKFHQHVMLGNFKPKLLLRENFLFQLLARRTPVRSREKEDDVFVFRDSLLDRRSGIFGKLELVSPQSAWSKQSTQDHDAPTEASSGSRCEWVEPRPALNTRFNGLCQKNVHSSKETSLQFIFELSDWLSFDAGQLS